MSGPVLIAKGVPLTHMARGGDEHLHVSAIIRHIAIGLGHITPTDDPINFDMLELGNILEEGIERRYPHFIRVGELEYDGLFGNCDFYDADNTAIVEVKRTSISTNNPAEGKKFWKYWVQGKAYCKMMESIGIHTTKVHLIIEHTVGDWDRTKPPSPVIHHWLWEFTQHEIDSNWAMIKAHAAQVKQKAYAAKSKPVRHR